MMIFIHLLNDKIPRGKVNNNRNRKLHLCNMNEEHCKACSITKIMIYFLNFFPFHLKRIFFYELYKKGVILKITKVKNFYEL